MCRNMIAFVDIATATYWAIKHKSKFGNIAFVSKIVITIGLLFTVSIWSLFMIWHLGQLMTPIYVTSDINISTIINIPAILLCLFCIAAASTTYHMSSSIHFVTVDQSLHAHDLKIQIACLMVVLVIFILWEFGRYPFLSLGFSLSIHVDMVIFLVYQWLIIFCLVYSFFIVPTKSGRHSVMLKLHERAKALGPGKTVEKTEKVEKIEKRSKGGKGAQKQIGKHISIKNKNKRKGAISITTGPVQLNRVLAHTTGLDSFFLHTMKEFCVGT